MQIGRIDGQGQPAQMIADQCGELADVGIQQYVIIDSAAQVSALPKSDLWLRIPERTRRTYPPQRLHGGLPRRANRVRPARIDGYGPTVSNLIRTKVLASGAELRGIEYIEACAPFPVNMKGAVHRYGDNDIVYATRTGASSAGSTKSSRCTSRSTTAGRGASAKPAGRRPARLTEEQAAHNIAWDWKFWERMMALFCIMYQINDGDGTENISNFGLFRVDGTLKEAWAATFRADAEDDDAANMIAITNATLFGPTPITGWLVGDFDGDLGQAHECRSTGGGPYLSIQPDGTYQGRPSGGGAYESFTKQGSDLVCPTSHDGERGRARRAVQGTAMITSEASWIPVAPTGFPALRSRAAADGGHAAGRASSGRSAESYRDDTGIFHPKGITFFWAMQGERHKTAKFEKHLDYLVDREHRPDEIRILAEVDWPGWHIDPHEAGYERHLGNVLDKAYLRGLRCQITLIGGEQGDALYGTVIDKVARVVNAGRRHMVGCFEIVNERHRLDKMTFANMERAGRLLAGAAGARSI